MATKLTIGFLGAGKMATALARGFIRAELVVPKEIIASDPRRRRAQNISPTKSARRRHGVQRRRGQNSPTS